MREIKLNQFMNKGLLEAGCDEAGRGPLAGPVFAAAVILPEDFHHPLLNDSKKMSLKSRDILRPIIEKEAISYAVEAVSSNEIDTINILNASIAGMWRCVMRLEPKPEFILIDGNRFKAYNSIVNIIDTDQGFIKTFIEGKYDSISYKTVVHGDATYASIAAASVLAKTARDEYMRNLALEYPEYGWDRNMGYPTKEHVEAIKKYGFTEHHRKSFHLKELEPTLF